MSRPRTIALPSIDYLRERLDYNPLTGILTWKPKDGSGVNDGRFNTRFAGKEAGTIQNLGYRFISINYNMLLGHRVAWAIHFGEWPEEIDHRNGNKLDNRLTNLRASTRAQNCHNRPGKSPTGFKGVGVNYSTKGVPSYTAFITHHGKGYHLGSYASDLEAAAAYRAGAMILHGDFANLGSRRVGKVCATVEFEMRAAA